MHGAFSAVPRCEYKRTRFPSLHRRADILFFFFLLLKKARRIQGVCVCLVDEGKETEPEILYIRIC